MQTTDLFYYCTRLFVPQDYFNFVCLTTLNQLFVAPPPLKALQLKVAFFAIFTIN